VANGEARREFSLWGSPSSLPSVDLSDRADRMHDCGTFVPTLLYRSGTYFRCFPGLGAIVMRQVSGDQLADFTAKVEELCGEFLQAVGRDRYSPAEVIQAACNLITAAITETRDKDLAIQATRRWIMTSLERAKTVNSAQIISGESTRGPYYSRRGEARCREYCKMPKLLRRPQ
jgi:hypothetical protein